MSGRLGVLIIEDDTDLRDCVRDELEHAGYRVFTAGNGREGLKRLEAAGDTCLVLLDLMMPIMNGYQFLAVLRDRHPHIPVVVTSSDGDAGAVPEGASEVLPKPFTVRALMAVVDRYC